MRAKKNAAFTLIEILFVIILIAIISTVVLPKVSSTFGLSIKSSVLQVSGFLESAYSQAVLSHKKIRLNFNMDTGEYWADDYADATTIPLITENTKLDDILNTFRKRSEEDESEEEIKKREDERFQKIETATLKTSKLPSSLKFKSIIFPAKENEGNKNGGIVSFFISSSGINDEVVIYLSHKDNTYSIIFPPTNGKPRIEKGEVDTKNL